MKQKERRTMKELPLSERPYEKVLENGSASLSDAELLAVILRSGARGVPAKELAEEVLALGSPAGLLGLLHGSLQDFMEIRGVGQVKAIQLACIGELSRRIWKAAAVEEMPRFDHPARVAARYMEEMRHMEQENLKLLILNTKNLLIREVDISRGTVNASLSTPRELFIEALLHNHPSGDPTPSKEDCLYTRRIQQAGNLLGIPLLDHIIIGDNSYVSLKERGIFET